MFSYVMFGLAVVDTAILLWALYEWQQLRHPALLLVAFLLLALPYDTAVVGAGRWLGIGTGLERLSGPRFMLFNLSLPLIIIVAAALARLAGFRWARSPVFIGTSCVLALVFIVADWRSILKFPDLYPACWQDILRYVPSVPSAQACSAGQAGVDVGGSLPPAALVALPALILVGILMWSRRDWPWLFWGAMAAFLLIGLPGTVFGPIPGFVGDTLNLVAITATAIHFLRHPPTHRTGLYRML